MTAQVIRRITGTIEYIGESEAMYNPDFKYTEFDTIKMSVL